MKGRAGIFAIVLMAALFNLPTLHLAWLNHRLSNDGVEVTATVVEAAQTGQPGTATQRLITYTFDDTLDPEQTQWHVDMTADGYAAAQAAGTVQVRVLEDDLAVSRVEGQRTSRLPLVLTIVGDVFLVCLGVLIWRRRPGLKVLRLVALGDVERAKPGAEVDDVGGGEFVVVGEVSLIDDDVVELTVAERTVRVRLDGHQNPVGYQQPARVRGRLQDG